MQTHAAKRVEIIIEAPMQRRLTDALETAGVTGYTVLPVRGGSGQSGPWTREGQVTSAGGMVAVVCLIRPERLDDLLDAALAEQRGGADEEVLRAELAVEVHGAGDDAFLIFDDGLDHLDGAGGRGVPRAGAHELDDLAAAGFGSAVEPVSSDPPTAPSSLLRSITGAFSRSRTSRASWRYSSATL